MVKFIYFYCLGSRIWVYYTMVHIYAYYFVILAFCMAISSSMIFVNFEPVSVRAVSLRIGISRKWQMSKNTTLFMCIILEIWCTQTHLLSPKSPNTSHEKNAVLFCDLIQVILYVIFERSTLWYFRFALHLQINRLFQHKLFYTSEVSAGNQGDGAFIWQRNISKDFIVVSLRLSVVNNT